MPKPKRLPPEQVDHLLSTRDHELPFGNSAADLGMPDSTARWSHSRVWAMAAGRVGELGTDDWADIAAEQRDWERQVGLLHASGADADGAQAADLVEEHRRSIERWYFICPPQLHAEVVAALLEDAGFRDRFDRHAPGAAEFIRSATAANAARGSAS